MRILMQYTDKFVENMTLSGVFIDVESFKTEIDAKFIFSLQSSQELLGPSLSNLYASNYLSFHRVGT